MAFPGTYNFSYYKGDTNEFVIRPKNSDGSAFDLTGYTAEYFIATSRGDNPTYSVEAQAVVNASTDIVTCTILPGVGSTLNAGTYVYDVQVTKDISTIYTLLTGTITVTEQVTGAA
jgi:glycine cleavage system H lipoate-binding protein